jgi:hypothetical protein
LELIAFPLDKTGGQIHRGNTSHLSGREGQNAELKMPIWGWSNLAAPVGKVRHCTALEKHQRNPGNHITYIQINWKI